MIDEVDDALRQLLREEAQLGGAAISFDPPADGWAEARRDPIVDLHLYDISEALEGRTSSWEDVHEEGRVRWRRPGRRWYQLAYAVTAWAGDTAAEHRLLSAVLRCLSLQESIPPDCLSGSLRELGVPVLLTVALPRQLDLPAPEWPRAARRERPSLDAVVTAPMQPALRTAAGAPVQDRQLSVGRSGGPPERVPTAARDAVIRRRLDMRLPGQRSLPEGSSTPLPRTAGE